LYIIFAKDVQVIGNIHTELPILQDTGFLLPGLVARAG
jgi:hypothetical protein